MSEVIVPLLKKGGQVEKKSTLVLSLGERGRAAGPAEGGGRVKRRERCYRRRIGSSSVLQLLCHIALDCPIDFIS